MADRLSVDLCVIGAGSGGLAVAAGASQMGARVALIERDRMGGDCLNYGCVPSKALLAAGRAAHEAREAGRFGVDAAGLAVDFPRVVDHVHGVMAAIAPHDSVERFTALGATVIRASARFTGPTEVTAGDYVVAARRVVVATGSRALIPPIPGLAAAPYFTNETIFENRTRPDHLIIIGGGPIGMEMAQAHRRLGAEVTVLEIFRSLGQDDPELARVVVTALRAEGVAIREGVEVVGVAPEGAGVAVAIEPAPGEREVITGSHLLVAAGRLPNIEDLDLDRAGVAATPRGITVDRRLRTSNRKVYAVGDVAGGAQFTHLAAHHAGVVIRNALFRLPARADKAVVPWVTYTDPELAQAGLKEGEARERHGRIRILRWPFAENDRAQTERAVDGLIKVVTDGRGRVLGAGIAGRHAGELILPWVLAVGQRLKIGALATAVAPYPTLGEAGKRAAGSYFQPQLFSPRTRSIVRFLARFG